MSESAIMSLLIGFIPVFPKADVRFSGDMALIYGLAVSSAIWYFVMGIPGFFCMYSWHSLLYISFIGPNTPTSRGWVKWLVCRGKTKSMMCLFAHSVKVRFTWDLCPSYRTRPDVLDEEFGQVVLEYLTVGPSSFRHLSLLVVHFSRKYGFQRFPLNT